MKEESLVKLLIKLPNRNMSNLISLLGGNSFLINHVETIEQVEFIKIFEKKFIMMLS